MNANGSIVSFWERFVMIWGPNMWLVVVFNTSQAQIDNQLLSSTNTKIGMYEGNVFF